MEMPPPVIPPRRDGMDQHNEGEGRGQKDHQRRQAVEDQHDPERGGPVSETVYMRVAICREDDETDRDGEKQCRANHGRDARENDVVAHDEPDNRREHGG